VKDEIAAINAFKMGTQSFKNAEPSSYQARLRGDRWEVWSGHPVPAWRGPPCTEVLKIAKRDAAQEWSVCVIAAP
jgi:hypothetical protein